MRYLYYLLILTTSSKLSRVYAQRSEDSMDPSITAILRTSYISGSEIVILIQYLSLEVGSASRLPQGCLDVQGYSEYQSRSLGSIDSLESAGFDQN